VESGFKLSGLEVESGFKLSGLEMESGFKLSGLATLLTSITIFTWKVSCVVAKRMAKSRLGILIFICYFVAVNYIHFLDFLQVK